MIWFAISTSQLGAFLQTTGYGREAKRPTWLRGLMVILMVVMMLVMVLRVMRRQVRPGTIRTALGGSQVLAAPIAADPYARVRYEADARNGENRLGIRQLVNRWVERREVVMSQRSVGCDAFLWVVLQGKRLGCRPRRGQTRAHCQELEHEIGGHVVHSPTNSVADLPGQCHQVLGLAAESGVDQLQLFWLGRRMKQWLAAEHLEKDATDAPNVDRCRVGGGTVQHIRWPVPEGDHFIGERFRWHCKRHIEISNLKSQISSGRLT